MVKACIRENCSLHGLEAKEKEEEAIVPHTPSRVLPQIPKDLQLSPISSISLGVEFIL
jgi:hypothetical protein